MVHPSAASIVLDLSFQALADGTRRAMLERLARGPASLGDLAEPFDMTLTAVAHHLRSLEAGGLVSTEKQGRVRMCRIEPEALRSMALWVVERSRDVGSPPDAIEAWLDGPPRPSKRKAKAGVQDA